MNPLILLPPLRDKVMKLYTTTYLSRVLNDVETKYHPSEKLCLCLYFSCIKLKQYIKPSDIYVYSHFDIIKHMLSKPILHSRVRKWALALTEYSLTCQSLKYVKGQIVADFIVDHSMVEDSLNFVDVQPWRLYFDGSRQKNGTGVGILIISPENIPTKFKFRLDKFCLNNEAEYEALIAGLEILLELGAKHVKIKEDFELVVKQLTKEYKCVTENLIIYFVTAKALLKRFDWASIQHVPRIENQEANDLHKLLQVIKSLK